MDRNEKLLNIIDRLLSICEYIIVNEPEDDDWEEKIEEFLDNREEDEEEDDECEWEITETVVDRSPDKLKAENEHLNNLVDMLCDTFGLTKYELEDWNVAVMYEKGLVEEIAKARKKLKK